MNVVEISEIDPIIDVLQKNLTSDFTINNILFKIKNDSVGMQNLILNRLALKLDHYGKNDLKKMLKLVMHPPQAAQPDDPKVYLQIADEAFNSFHIITLKDSEQLMVFNSGCYSFDHSELDRFISGRIESYNVPHRYTYAEVIDYIKKNTLYDRNELNYDPEMIIFENGHYDLEANTFTPHAQITDLHGWHFFCEIPHYYKDDKRYHCPKFKALLRQWLSLPFSKVRVQDIFEAIGLCMTVNVSFKASFMNYGPAHTGKTQFFNIVKYIIGIKNMSALTLQRITKNEFGTVGLQFKLLNYCSDLGSRRIWDTSIYKNLTGGDDLVWGEIKGGNSFGFKPTAKFWFNANKIPAIEDIDDDAFFERFIMFMFGNVFTKENNPMFELDYFKQIINDLDEVQGIIHEAIRGFIRLKKRQGFRQTIRENTKHIWNYESDQIYAYIYDFCKLDRTDFIKVDELYENYMNNCRGVPNAKNSFTKALQRHGVIKKKMTREDENGKRPECYYGITIKYKKEDVKEDAPEITSEQLEILYGDRDYSDPGGLV